MDDDSKTTHGLIPDDIPPAMYVYEDKTGNTHVLAVYENLSTPLNFDSVLPEMLLPQTPSRVRALLFNKLFFTRERKTYVRDVHLHTTPSGLTFFEVRLSKAGFEYMKVKHSGGMYHPETYTAFDPYAPWPTSGKKPKPPLMEAMSYLGMTPRS